MVWVMYSNMQPDSVCIQIGHTVWCIVSPSRHTYACIIADDRFKEGIWGTVMTPGQGSLSNVKSVRQDV